MSKGNLDFCAGVLVGILMSFAMVTCIEIAKYEYETTGYENKLVIKYYNPNKEYDREMVRNMVNDSQVCTNFVFKEMKMERYGIEYIMMNPQ